MKYIVLVLIIASAICYISADIQCRTNYYCEDNELCCFSSAYNSPTCCTSTTYCCGQHCCMNVGGPFPFRVRPRLATFKRG